MARVIYSTQVNEIKGSVGGLTFHQNTSGSIVKLKPFNRNVSTKVQSEGKSLFVQLTSLWNSLSADDKQTWADEIVGVSFVNRYNESKGFTPFNLFMSANLGRLLLNMAPVSTLGSYTAPIDVPAFDLTVNSGELSCLFDSTSEDPNVYYFFYASPPNRLAYTKQRTQLRLVAAVVPNGETYFDLTTYFEDAFGLTWPIANESNAFKIDVAVCSFDYVHGCWSTFTIVNNSFIQL